MGVAGAVLGITIILIVPTLYHYKVCASTPTEKNTDIVFIVFSFLVLCLCTYKGVDAWINDGAEATMGGVFVDPNHFQKDTFQGVRFITDNIGENTSDTITLIGSDDGTSFWQLEGKWNDKDNGDLTVDFSTKNSGPPNLKGQYKCENNNKKCKITWEDGNFWTKIDSVSSLKE